jgi:hypothetical protein
MSSRTADRLALLLNRFAPSAAVTPLPHVGLIDWTQALGAPRRARALLEAFYTPAEIEAALFQEALPWRLGCALDEAQLQALLPRFRRSAAAVLGPLMLPPDTTEFLAAVHHMKTAGAAAAPADVTVFRRVSSAPRTLSRVLVAPPLAEREFVIGSAQLPAPLVPLYYAWHTLTHRHELGFDSQTVGLEFLHDGCIFINWNRFGTSLYWPRAYAQLAPSSGERERGLDAAQRLAWRLRRR